MHRPVIMNDCGYVSEIFSSIQGEGYLAGRRQIFIRLTDCNLDCKYCDTDHAKSEFCRVETKPGAAAFRLLNQPLAVGQIHGIIADWLAALPGAHHSISITGGEPLLSADLLKSWLPDLRGLLPIHLETNGTMYIALEQVIQHVDYISMDMKLPSTSGCTENLWDLHRLFLQTAHARDVSVKIVVGDETDLGEIDQTCNIIEAVDSTIPLFIQPITLADGLIGIKAGHLMRLQELASSMLPDVRVIPQMHKLLGAL